MMEQPIQQKWSVKVQWTKLLLATALALTSLTPFIANADSAPPQPGPPGGVKPPPDLPPPLVSWNT